MTKLQGVIRDIIELGDRRWAIMLTEVDGVPRHGMKPWVNGVRQEIEEVGTNSTDGQVVSTQSCLTGQRVAPCCSIGVIWRGEAPVAKNFVGAVARDASP